MQLIGHSACAEIFSVLLLLLFCSYFYVDGEAIWNLEWKVMKSAAASIVMLLSVLNCPYPSPIKLFRAHTPCRRTWHFPHLGPHQHHVPLTLDTLQLSHTESFRISWRALSISCNFVFKHIIPPLLPFPCLLGKLLHAPQNPSPISPSEERQGYWATPSMERSVM